MNDEIFGELMRRLLTGEADRAVAGVQESEELDPALRSALVDALRSADDVPGRARAVGDALRLHGAPQGLVNEVYRAAFYTGSGWRELVDNPLFAYAMANRTGAVLDKWPHYFPVYDRHLSPWRGTDAKILEIGVYRGGGLDMWRWYFGERARLVGVDVDDVAKTVVGQRHQVVLGDQADPEFLARLAAEHGPFDVVIDDGGHTMEQQIASAEALFEHVVPGGVYLVEDCHTSYWPEYGGGLRREGTFVEWAKSRVDDVHGYHVREEGDHVHPVWTEHVGGLHVYDSIVVLDREDRFAPFAQQTGTVASLLETRAAAASTAEIIATRDAAVLTRQATDERVGELDEKLAELRRDLEAAHEQLRVMRGTTSWKVTAPLRKVRSLGG